MKKNLIVFAVFFFALRLIVSQSLVSFPDTAFEFPDAKMSKEILLQDDLYLTHLSPFDLCAKVQKKEQVALEQFKEFLGKQTLSWTKKEIMMIEKIIVDVKDNFSYSKLIFPKKIYLVKTTGEEEGGAAYCRNMDTVVFPLSFLKYDEAALKEIFVHELFHIFTRNNPEIMDKLYESIGFTKTGELKLPSELANLAITNPDAVLYNYCFDTQYMGKPVRLIPVLIAKAAFDPKKSKNFFDYLTVQFMSVEDINGITSPVVMNGKYVLLKVNMVENFYEKVGENTDYIIGAEEILADNFTLLIMRKKEIKTPKILEGIKSILQ
jgi:hypothetical protein